MQVLLGPGPPSIQGILHYMGASGMEEETSELRAMRSGAFPGREQSKRRVSQWLTSACSLWKKSRGMTGARWERPQPRDPGWEGTGTEAEQSRERR